MPVQYTNRGGKVYYLHRGLTKTGKPKYYFSMKVKENLVDSIPEGYEIYEDPISTQVFLRRKEPQVITDSETMLVEDALDQLKVPRRYLVKVRGRTITIFESGQDLDALKSGPDLSPLGFFRSRLEEALDRFQSYSAIMRFTLVDEEHRVFDPERFCFRGAMDDWISIGGPDRLDALIHRFFGFLGKDSFYELY